MRIYYHATKPENGGSILTHGLLPSSDGYVYLADSIENAARFLCLNCHEILVFSVHINKNEETNIEETFDHSEKFFKCKAYGYRGTIPPQKIGRIYTLESRMCTLKSDD